jgi:hypothetical protein
MNFPVRRLLALAGAALVVGALGACNNDDGTTVVTVDVPSNVQATAIDSTSILVTWNQVSGADHYEIDQAEGAAALASANASLTATAYTATGLKKATLYHFVVRAVKGTTRSSNSTDVTATTKAGGVAGPKVATVNGIPLSRTFFADTTYVLSGYVKVSNGATLTIQAGTRIVGDTLVTGSSLWILRGSKINAVGTAAAPIVFTSQRAAGNRKPGDWGGIIVVGRAPINRTASPIFTEGPTGAAEDYSGGTDFNDNSGTIQYVRVEFAGYDVSNGGGQELNSISSYAVGRGTTYDYVESMAGLDDAFESFGGGYDMRHMVSFESGDDHFDWTEGYHGRGQYLIALQTSVIQPKPGTGTVSSDPRGFEGDGCESDKAGCTFANKPYSIPVWANFTIVGPGAGVFTPTDGNGAVVRRGSGGVFVNGIIARWPGVGVSVRDAESNAMFATDSLYFRNLVLAENGSNFEPAGTNFGSKLKDNATAWKLNEATLAATFAGTLPTGTTDVTTTNINLELNAASGAVTGGLSSFAGTPLAGMTASYFGGTMPATAYIGAIDPASATAWFDGWTQFVRK